MPRTVQEILDHADEFAQRFEEYEPAAEDERDPQSFALRQAVASEPDTRRATPATVAQSAGEALA